MVRSMHVKLSSSMADTRLTTIAKTPFKKCNRNMNKLAPILEGVT